MLAVITGIDDLTFNDSNNIVLFYETHVESPENYQQLRTFKEYIEQYDKTNTNSLHILSEVAGFLQPDPALWATPHIDNVANSIFMATQETSRATAQDIEIRHVAISALYLLSLPKCLIKNTKNDDTMHYQFGNKSYPLSYLNLCDLINEYTSNKLRLLKLFGQMPEINVLLSKKIESLKRYENQFQIFLVDNKLKKELSLLTIARKLSHQKSNDFHNILSDLFTDLFDLHTLYELISCSSKNKILITGHCHAGWIKEMLLKLGSKIILCHGDGISTLMLREHFLSLLQLF